ncbi:MAG: hypothetical protein HOW97_34185 [Catenulispora sp.]|nr:hypothetical protein [Catenulispora sp.]
MDDSTETPRTEEEPPPIEVTIGVDATQAVNALLDAQDAIMFATHPDLQGDSEH